MLYDKINIIRNGHQRYGTQYDISKKGEPPTLLPIENEAMIDEYRNRVGLVPLSDF